MSNRPDWTADLESRFAYHKLPNETVALAHQVIRETLRHCAGRIVAMVPVCREQSLAITKIEEAMMWANAAIARHGCVEEVYAQAPRPAGLAQQAAPREGHASEPAEQA